MLNELMEDFVKTATTEIGKEDNITKIKNTFNEVLYIHKLFYWLSCLTFILIAILCIGIVNLFFIRRLNIELQCREMLNKA